MLRMILHHRLPELHWIFTGCFGALIHKALHKDAILVCIHATPWPYWDMSIFHDVLSQESWEGITKLSIRAIFIKPL